MRPEDRDAALLWDMREAAREIQKFTNIPDLLQALNRLVPPVDWDDQ